MTRSNTGILSAFAATGLVAFALAGCGGGGSSSSASTAGGSAYEQSTAKTSSAASTTPAATGSTGTAGAAGAGAAGAGAGVATISVTHSGELGSILVSGPKQRTVYLFAADKGPMSTCSSACAEVWPPVTTTGNPKAAAGANAADLGTITRSDGTKQVTYKGHPLYFYAGDGTSGGETSGQAINSFGALWYVLSPSGSEVK
jgi:predicted lipoprotein with Yx(FWY)xxD motif